MARGIQFTNRARDIHDSRHIFDRVCDGNGIEHRLTKINHPWSLEDQQTIQWIVCPTNGQVERMNRTTKDATVRRHHYADHEQLRSHLADFLSAHNYARRLKTLRGLTPFEFISRRWTEEPERFRINPAHHTAGLNS